MHMRQGFTSSSRPFMRHCVMYPGQAVVEHGGAFEGSSLSKGGNLLQQHCAYLVRCFPHPVSPSRHSARRGQRRCHLLQGAAGA
jgi:hypothetical protein